MKLILALACILLLTGCPAKDDPVTPDARTPQQALSMFAEAVQYKDSDAACDLMSKKAQQDLVERAVEAKLMEPKETLCIVGFVAYFDRETSLGRKFVVRATTVLEEREARARGEIEWRESEPGDGMGVDLVKQNNRWLVSRF